MTTQVTTDPTIETITAALLGTARAMTQPRMHDTLRKKAHVDLDRSGAALLYKLYTEGESLRLTDLADRLGVDAPAVTRKVQQLEQAELVCRSADPADARASRLRLTRRGRLSIERLLAARRQWLEELLTDWSAEDRRELARLLELFAATIARHEATPDGD